MKLKATFAATPFLILIAFLPIYGQATNGSADSFANSTALSEGVKLSKNKKLDQARKKFKESSRFWQVNHTSSLYLTILNDVDNKRLQKKNAANIFKAVHEDLKAKSKKALKQINKVLRVYKNASTAAAFFNQKNVTNRHFLINRLTHIVNC